MPMIEAWWRGDSRLPLSLALQGGGAHGAFTWGVLDALLERRAHRIAAISGTSAGALNAVALAQGWMHGGPDGAREALSKVWHAVGTQMPFDWLTVGQGDELALAPAARAMLHWTHYLSPYQLNPLDLNPMRELLCAHIDFERLRRASPIRLYIAATHANSGRLRLFRRQELSVDAVLASTCLPTMHHAVHIDGEPYWDGGYSANPALFPLVADGRPADLLIVMLSPLAHAHTPRSAAEIRERALEIAFNATFLREAQLLAEAQALARRSWWPSGALERRLKRLRWHVIDAEVPLGGLRTETKLIAHMPFLQRLHDEGRQQALAWLDGPGRLAGQRSSADLRQLLGGGRPRPAAQDPGWVADRRAA
jgi:NTE family protein